MTTLKDTAPHRVDLVDVKTKDFLEQDDAIRGQNYVCLSFLSPEDVIRSKEAYFVKEYMHQYVNRNIELMDGLQTLFPDKSDELRSIREQYATYFDKEAIVSDYADYKVDNEIRVSELYSQENEFQTNIRGVKVRGSYESLQEAQSRAEALKRKDNDKFNIYVAQVGCWCPWAINPNDIDNAEYSETQLNTMMKEYHKNKDSREMHYNERKEEMINRATENAKNTTIVEEEENEEEAAAQEEKETQDHREDVKQALFGDEEAV